MPGPAENLRSLQPSNSSANIEIELSALQERLPPLLSVIAGILGHFLAFERHESLHGCLRGITLAEVPQRRCETRENFVICPGNPGEAVDRVVAVAFEGIELGAHGPLLGPRGVGDFAPRNSQRYKHWSIGKPLADQYAALRTQHR